MEQDNFEQQPFDSADKLMDFFGTTALVVEDDFGARQLLTHMLRTLKVEIIEAESGEEAQTIMQTRTVDIMLLDIALGPGMSGLQLGYNLRQDDRHRNTPLVAVTAYSEEKMKSLKEMGFDACLAKPYDISQLKKMLTYFLKDN